MDHHHSGSSHAALCGVFLCLALVCLTTPLFAAPVLGFREEFPGTGTGGWASQALRVNPGTGGRLGSGDGYLEIERGPLVPHLSIRCRLCPEYTGDWVAAGITQVRLWLNDVNTDDPLEIHVSLGSDLGFWQYNIGFTPPNGQWAEYVVELGNPADFTRTLGSGTFEDALANVEILHVRHDLPPFMQEPDSVNGDLGIDGILLTNGLVAVEPPSPVVLPLSLAAPYPNPSRGPVAFSFRTYDEGSVSLRVVDVGGRLIRSVDLPRAPGGQRIWMWDGRDGAGRLAPPGSYRVFARGASGGMSRPFVRIR